MLTLFCYNLQSLSTKLKIHGMRQSLFYILMIFQGMVYSQQMNNQLLSEIIHKHADTINGETGNWKFIHQNVLMICVTDEQNNRMRIISPITESKNLDEDLLLDTLTANFHSALDVKYAISNGILWSAYVHPLKELTPEQAEDAISQVYYAAKTFGTTFSSTKLIFGGKSINAQENDQKSEPEEKKLKRF